MLKSVPVPVADIYVPVKLRAALDPARAEALAESILEQGQQSPIQVRRDKERFVLVTGLHRLEAVRLLGEKTVDALIVSARRV
ncbi:MAG TPA: ParB N-terminal domain-containing protein [Candidatus Sulfotelmatobacter sp.]|jgi:ParB-like chromosome segregation protein Spo0J|nr:ParB N-terminal domain-containing protein [Candidatus Sulfotelmatobacter sp.]